ncbi:MAG: cell wall hydrolase, partial [Halothermotrichaceae bacterium]
MKKKRYLRNYYICGLMLFILLSFNFTGQAKKISTSNQAAFIEGLGEINLIKSPGFSVDNNFKIIGYTNLSENTIITKKYKKQDKDGANYIYIVQPGASLYKIAQKFNTTISKLKAVNNLDTNMIIVGQELFIPDNRRSDGFDNPEVSDNPESPEQPDQSPNSPETPEQLNQNPEKDQTDNADGQVDMVNLKAVYQVEETDDLTTISNKFGIASEKIAAENNLVEDRLSPGQEIIIHVTVPEHEVGTDYLVTEDELKLLARAVYSEARGEPFKGQVAVASVVLNRVHHSYFPDTIEEVIFQPHQFSAVDDGQFWLEPSQQSYTAARAALDGWDPSKEAL